MIKEENIIKRIIIIKIPRIEMCLIGNLINCQKLIWVIIQ